MNLLQSPLLLPTVIFSFVEFRCHLVYQTHIYGQPRIECNTLLAMYGSAPISNGNLRVSNFQTFPWGGVFPQTLPVLHAYACIPCTSDTNITLILKILATGLGYKPKLVTRVRISLKNYQEHPQHLQSHKTMAVNNAQCNYLWVIALLHSFSTLTHYCIGRML